MICVEESLLYQRANILAWIYMLSIGFAFFIGLWLGNLRKKEKKK